MIGRLLPAYREMAADNRTFLGFSIVQHSKAIGKVLRAHECVTVLDYGSGRGDAYVTPHTVHMDWSVKRPNVTLYDPSFDRHANLPTRMFDAVVCSDVLEHIPEDEVVWAVSYLFAHARKVVWASVCCRPASKTFPDGTNLHVTLWPFQRWQELFEDLARGQDFVLVESP